MSDYIKIFCVNNAKVIEVEKGSSILEIFNKSGVTLRTHVSSLSVIGRAAQGVRLIDLGKRNDEIASVCKVATVIEEEIEE